MFGRSEYINIRVANMAGTITGYVEATVIEGVAGTLNLLWFTADAAAVAVMTAHTPGERERLHATGRLPYFQMIATENRPGGSEVTFPRVSLEEIELRPMNKAGWWCATREARATIHPPARPDDN
jgi:hypothetical protein